MIDDSGERPCVDESEYRMAIKEQVTVLFLDRQGKPLPDWLQKPLQRQVLRLSQRFPLLMDLAVIQNVLDGVGQRIIAKVNGGVKIANMQA